MASSSRLRLTDIAQEQWGLITRRQAELAGVPPSTIARLRASGGLQPVAHGVYRIAGSAPPDHLELRAAWLQLAPATPAWERDSGSGAVSHRSAAALYGLGHLPADRHEFTLPDRRQTRRPDVRLHRARLRADDWGFHQGLPVTSPARTAADLLADREDPAAVGHVVADALREKRVTPGALVERLGAHAFGLGLRKGDGVGVLTWLLELVGDPESPRWLEAARRSRARRIDDATGAAQWRRVR